MKSRKTILLVGSLLLGTTLYATNTSEKSTKGTTMSVLKSDAQSSALRAVQQARTIKGTTTGTITDFDGNFSIEVKSDQMLEISYIGYISQTLKPTNGMQVVLQEDAQAYFMDVIPE